MYNASTIRTSLLGVLVGVAAIATPAYANGPGTIVDIAVATDDVSTLVTAVQAADLVGTLSSDGPFTVFAPVNSAFGDLDPDVLSDLLLPENVGQLTNILTYHVVSGQVLAADLSDGQTIETVHGGSLTVAISGSDVMIDNAKVIATDVLASNGVIHLIDAVMLPSIAEVAVKAEFDALVNAASSQGLVGTLDTGGPFTVFAPTDEAFEKLPGYVTRALASKPELLTDILLYHVVSGTIPSNDVPRVARVDTVVGEKVLVRNNHGTIRVNNAKVVLDDQYASNGVVHVIDRVLIPKSVMRESLKELRRQALDIRSKVERLRG